MKVLERSWLALLMLGLALILMDTIAEKVPTFAGIPAFAAVGAALVITVISSWLAWRAKIAWEDRLGASSIEQHGNSSH